MKKIFTILLIMPLIWACSSSDDNGYNDQNTHITDIITNKEVIGVGQKIGFKILSSNQVGGLEVVVNGDKVDVTIGQNFEWIPTTIGKNTIELYSYKNNKPIKLFEKDFNVVTCDFGVAVWGDKKDIILRSEKGVPASAEHLSDVVYNLSGNRVRIYAFKGADKLSTGIETADYYISQMGAEKSNLVSLRYMENVSVLKSKFGDPIKSDLDRYNITTEYGRKQMGTIILNGLEINTTFKTDRTFIECYTELNKNSTVRIVTKYTKI